MHMNNDIRKKIMVIDTLERQRKKQNKTKMERNLYHKIWIQFRRGEVFNLLRFLINVEVR